MTITSYCLAIGKSIPNSQIFKHVLDASAEFCERLKKTFDGTNLATYAKFVEFLEDGAPAENNPEKWSAEEHDDMINTYSDWTIDLANYLWILPSGKELQIIRIPHDIDENDAHIVGEIVDTMEHSKIAEIEIDKLDNIRNVRTQFESSGEWTGTKLYIIPNDCSCCT